MTERPDAADSLSAIFRRLIANTGPISVMQYMGEANARYYASRDPLGTGGDFVTAPEISQMFGELIGLWLSDLWIRAGRRERAHYVELGPGRGTLARDALRTMARFGLTPGVHFIEGSAALRRVQRAALPDAHWHHDLSTVPDDGPILLVGNEFLDALPIRQLVRTEAGWRERMIGYEAGSFIPVAGDKPMDAALPDNLRDAPAGTILETCPGAASVVQEVAGRLASQGGAALFIDYGHADPRTGSTLQAVRDHRKVDPFAEPGEADLTVHVDFSALAPIVQASGSKVLGTVTQGAWLTAMGIATRAENLAAAAPDQTAAIRVAKERLTSADQMGELFKVIGLVAPDWPEGAGF